jgi:hypothetical protein
MDRQVVTALANLGPALRLVACGFGGVDEGLRLEELDTADSATPSSSIRSG